MTYQNLDSPEILKILKKLKSKTVIDSITNCWLWQGSKTDSGYGEIRFESHNERVHRLSAHIYLGYSLGETIHQINHKRECLNRHCWNPDHIYIGTKRENTEDAMATGKITIKLHCKNGHKLTEDNITYGSKGARNCKICARERANNWYAINKRP